MSHHYSEHERYILLLCCKNSLECENSHKNALFIHPIFIFYIFYIFDWGCAIDMERKLLSTDTLLVLIY